jgi:hypothetical protein
MLINESSALALTNGSYEGIRMSFPEYRQPIALQETLKRASFALLFGVG